MSAEVIYQPRSLQIQQDAIGPIIRDVRGALDKLDNDQSINVDLETSSLHVKTTKVAVVSMHGNDSNHTAVLHLRGYQDQDLIKFLSERRRTYIFQNGVGFDIPILAQYGVDIWDHNVYDTMVGEQTILTSGRRDVRVNLDAIGKRRLREQIKTKKVDHGGWMNQTLDETQLSYCANDVRKLGRIKEAQEETADADLKRALRTEMRLVNVVARMKYNGMPMDVQVLYNFLVEQHKLRQRLGPKLRGFFEEPNMNIGSHVQLKKALAKAGINVPNTRAETLDEYAKYARNDAEGFAGTRDGNLCKAILEYKHARKRMETYTPDWVMHHVIHGRVHPNFWQTGTETGRFSCTDPNMQQVPVNMRQVFGGLPGHNILSADYSQIEVRIAAALAEDHVLIDLIKSGQHFHTALAAETFEIPYDQVTPDMVYLTKHSISFVLFFGGGKQRFFDVVSQSGSKLSRVDSDAIVDKFFKRFQGIWNMRLKAQSAGRSGRPVTLKMATGLRRVLIPRRYKPSSPPTVPSTQILNTSVQGNAAAGIKYAMLECKKSGLDKYLSLQVHDELVSTVPETETKDYEEELVACMKRGMLNIMDVPVDIKTLVGHHWS